MLPDINITTKIFSRGFYCGHFARFFDLLPRKFLMQETNSAEIKQVSGSRIPVVVWEIGAWAMGGILGAGLAVAAIKFLS
jgi:hypothetical protein